VKGEDQATPRLSKGGQGEVVRQRFSILGAFSLGSLVKKPLDRNDAPTLVNKTKQHTLKHLSAKSQMGPFALSAAFCCNWIASCVLA